MPSIVADYQGDIGIPGGGIKGQQFLRRKSIENRAIGVISPISQHGKEQGFACRDCELVGHNADGPGKRPSNRKEPHDSKRHRDVLICLVVALRACLAGVSPFIG